jgi:hypothetical protein
MHVMHVFPGRFRWIFPKQQRSACKDQKMDANCRFEVTIINPSSRRSKWIYETYKLKLKREKWIYGTHKLKLK